jgi:hypothetical protein
LINARTDIDEPTLAIDLVETLDPKVKESNNDIFIAHLADSVIDNDDPTLTKFLKETLEPITAKVRQDMAEPKRTPDLTLKLDPQ